MSRSNGHQQINLEQNDPEADNEVAVSCKNALESNECGQDHPQHNQDNREAQGMSRRQRGFVASAPRDRSSSSRPRPFAGFFTRFRGRGSTGGVESMLCSDSVSISLDNSFCACLRFTYVFPCFATRRALGACPAIFRFHHKRV